MSYGEVIKSAFWIAWRNRFLWFFGFFVAGGGAFNVFNVPTNLGNRGNLPGPGPWITDNVVAILIIVGIVVLLLALVFIVLAIVSTGGLAESVAAIDRGEQRRFSSTFRAGLSNFWRVLGQAILIFLIALGLLLLTALVVGVPIGLTFVLTESVEARVLVSVLFGLLGVLLLIVLFVPLAIIGQFALRGLVVGGQPVATSIAIGYGLFRQNLGRSLIVWIISIALSIGIGIAFFVALLIVGLILFLPTILLVLAENTTAATIAGVIAGVILLPVLLVLSGAIGTFNHAYWTLAYLRLTGHPEGSQPGQASAAA